MSELLSFSVLFSLEGPELEPATGSPVHDLFSPRLVSQVEGLVVYSAAASLEKLTCLLLY